MNYKFKTKPYEHQLDALNASCDKENFAYFMEMGTGKSKVLLDNAAMLYDKGQINGLLLIAPKGVYKNWYDQEVPTHLPDHIEKKMVLWKTSDKSKKQIRLGYVQSYNDNQKSFLTSRRTWKPQTRPLKQ